MIIACLFLMATTKKSKLIDASAEACYRAFTDAKEDRYCARFVELRPNKRVVEAIEFETRDARFMGEMIMEVGFTPAAIAKVRRHLWRSRLRS